MIYTLHTVQITFIFIDFRVCDFAFAFKTQNAPCQTHFEFLSQFRKVRNAFECFVAQVQTHLPKTKRVWPMNINVICIVLIIMQMQSEVLREFAMIETPRVDK